MPLELRAGVERVSSDIIQDVEDGAYVGTAIDTFRRSMGLNEWRQLSINQKLILDDLKLSKISVDKVTRFSIRPPEFLKFFDKLGDYFRWFSISDNKIKVDDFPLMISHTLSKSCWIDGLQRQIRVRKAALNEIILWCGKIK